MAKKHSGAGYHRKTLPADNEDEEGLIEYDVKDAIAPFKPDLLDRMTDKQYDDLSRLSRLGFTYKSMASWLGVDYGEFCKMLEEHPRIKQGLENERAITVGSVSEVCLQKALRGDINAIRLFLQHVGRWNVKQEVVSENNTVNVQVNNLLGRVPIDKIAELLREQNETVDVNS